MVVVGEMMMRGESGEFSSLDLLGHDVGRAAGRDAAGRRGRVEVVEGKVADGRATRCVDVDGGVVVGTSSFLERRCHMDGYGNGNKKKLG